MGGGRSQASLALTSPAADRGCPLVSPNLAAAASSIAGLMAPPKTRDGVSVLAAASTQRAPIRQSSAWSAPWARPGPFSRQPPAQDESPVRRTSVCDVRERGPADGGSGRAESGLPDADVGHIATAGLVEVTGRWRGGGRGAVAGRATLTRSRRAALRGGALAGLDGAVEASDRSGTWPGEAVADLGPCGREVGSRHEGGFDAGFVHVRPDGGHGPDVDVGADEGVEAVGGVPG